MHLTIDKHTWQYNYEDNQRQNDLFETLDLGWAVETTTVVDLLVGLLLLVVGGVWFLWVHWDGLSGGLLFCYFYPTLKSLLSFEC